MIFYLLFCRYFWQVWPSKVGIAKPFYFPLLPSYWLPEHYANLFTLSPQTSGPDLAKVHVVNATEIEMIFPNAKTQLDVDASIILDVEKGTSRSRGNGFFEADDEAILGQPTVVVNKLRKTFGSQVSVNDLSFKMYENQIFALLGHNGAGKVSTGGYPIDHDCSIVES